MNKTKHIAQFEAFKAKGAINESRMGESLNPIICITDYSGTIAVGQFSNGGDQAYLEQLGPDAVVTRLDQGNAERDFVSYDDEGVFELIEEGTSYTAGTGFVFPLLGEGKFLCLYASGHSYDWDLISPMDLKKFF
jgi:hypothetical protein